MTRRLMPALCLAALVSGCAVNGNDTGGIISWTPENEAGALGYSADHCNRYGKYAVITSVHPWPGAYIGFECRRPRRYEPAKR